MQTILRNVLLSMVLLTTVVTAQADEEIIVWDRMLDNPTVYKILQLALEKSRKEFGDYQLKVSSPMEQGRVELEIRRNEYVHVASFAPSLERESRLLPVRIPVTKGMLGMRVCLIAKGNQARFDGISSIEQWRKAGLRIGQGMHWPDTQILRRNDLPVVTSSKYLPLFAMLEKQRFDCFSRSITEVLPELEARRGSNLEIERHLLLTYPLPTFFFVSRNNKKLAARIESGMTAAMKDGSLDKIIHADFAETLRRLNIGSRKVIPLENPLLSEKTLALTKNKHLWFSPENIDK